ncbi:MAG TPA: lipocalin-like domain-containing protein [Steroidobacteraceae bacterium]|nr:lipocalin-like domain-containing protein [Steroidobacteraceae bacterium]
MSRRRTPALAILLASIAAAHAPDTTYAPVLPGYALQFPRDFGSHPQFRTEWWYLTGWLRTAAGAPLGFQITFFRDRPDIWRGNPSAFTPRQVLIAHCALADPAHRRLWRAQRIERAGFDLAGARTGDTAVWIGRWRLARERGVYHARCAGARFALDLAATPSEPPLPNGADGYSRKGPDPYAASEYYSIPQLRIAGRVIRAGRAAAVVGDAWLDHEWSSAYLDRGAVGWDWIGIDLNDGGSLMAFRIRGGNGATIWAGGTLRGAHGRVRVLAPGDVRFSALRRWRSPRTGVRYPVEWRVRAGDRRLTLRPLLDDQENDARATSGALYWEGAVRAYAGGRIVGHGYLELTGYGAPLRLH